MVEVDEAVRLGLKLKDAHIWDTVLSWLILALSSSFLVSCLGNTGVGLGQEADLQDGCCQGKEGEDKLEPMFALMQALDSLGSNRPQFSEQDEESRDEKENLRHEHISSSLNPLLENVHSDSFFFYRQCHLQVQSRGGWRDEEWTYEERCSDSLGLNSLQLYGHAHKQTRHPVVVCKVDGKRFTPGTKMGI